LEEEKRNVGKEAFSCPRGTIAMLWFEHEEREVRARGLEKGWYGEAS